MAIDSSPETLLKLQTEITVTRANHHDLTWKVRQRRLAEHARLEASTVGRAHRVRDQLLTSPARHAALLASRDGIMPAALSAGLDLLMRRRLQRVAARPH